LSHTYPRLIINDIDKVQIKHTAFNLLVTFLYNQNQLRLCEKKKPDSVHIIKKEKKTIDHTGEQRLLNMKTVNIPTKESSLEKKKLQKRAHTGIYPTPVPV